MSVWLCMCFILTNNCDGSLLFSLAQWFRDTDVVVAASSDPLPQATDCFALERCCLKDKQDITFTITAKDHVVSLTAEIASNTPTPTLLWFTKVSWNTRWQVSLYLFLCYTRPAQLTTELVVTCWSQQRWPSFLRSGRYTTDPVTIWWRPQ